MNYFLYNLATQHVNTGDLLINKSLVNLLRKHGQVIVDDRNTPTTFIEQLLAEGDQRLSSITDQSLFDFIEDKLKIPSEDTYYLVLVPGDISIKGFKAALAGTWFFISRLRKLKQMGCRILRLGVSLNTFDLPNILAESLYSRAYHVYGLRDEQSITKANRFYFSNVRYFPDLAWAYHPQPVGRARIIKEKYILISFRANRYGGVHDSDYFLSIKKQLIDVLSQSSLHRYKIIVSYQVQYDQEAGQELVELLANDFNVEFIDKVLSLEEAIHLYTGADLIISNRLHVLLLGTICKTLSIPFINPLDNKKIAGIYKDNAIYDMVLDYRKNATEISNKLVDMIERKEVILHLLEEKHRHNASIIKNLINDIVND